MLRNIRLDHLCICVPTALVYCGKTAEWIRMPFEVVNGVDRRMGVLNGDGDRRRGRGSFGGEFGRPIVTNGAFATRLFSNYSEHLLASAI